MGSELAELLIPDGDAWGAWLGDHHDEVPGVWLVLAKKGTTEPTSLGYDEALEQALCHGWIDGQVRRRDELTYRQRFTPRRARSKWSRRNVSLVERLLADGRMHPAGVAAMERAKTDGNWQVAYEGQAAIEVPDDLARALAGDRAAQATFETLTSQNRYAILYRIETLKRADARARRIEKYVTMLARGDAIHPQRRGQGG
jgi:uncharacterized protein YdeI (YjbR/CyaY-like superfamily)